MLKLRLADYNIHIDNKYEYLEKMCGDYLFDGTADMTVSATEEEIMKEQSEKITHKGYLESLAVYRKIAEKIPYMDGFLMHGVVVDIEGTGVAFLAKSGVGKTTHTMNWKALLGDKMTVVNGDKPLIRVTDSGIYAYGTPWAGKENIHTNMKTQLKKICFIERNEENECERFDGDPLKRLLSQTYRPADTTSFFKTLDLLNRLINNTSFYLIKCNKDASSAQVAFDAVINQKFKEKNNG